MKAEKNITQATEGVLPGMESQLQKTNEVHVLAVRKAAEEVRQTTTVAVNAYFNLCEAVRELPPKQARIVLAEEGFDKVRMSEIIRVAHTTPELFSQYKNKAIGFKLALKKARAGGEAEESAEASDEGETEAGEKPKPRAKSDQTKFLDALLSAVSENVPLAGKVPSWAFSGGQVTHGNYIFTWSAKSADQKKPKNKQNQSKK